MELPGRSVIERALAAGKAALVDAFFDPWAATVPEPRPQGNETARNLLDATNSNRGVLAPGFVAMDGPSRTRVVSIAEWLDDVAVADLELGRRVQVRPHMGEAWVLTEIQARPLPPYQPAPEDRVSITIGDRCCCSLPVAGCCPEAGNLGVLRIPLSPQPRDSVEVGLELTPHWQSRYGLAPPPVPPSDRPIVRVYLRGMAKRTLR